MDGDVTAVQVAQRLFQERRDRDRLLGGYVSLMGEPVWDMLLQLTINGGGQDHAPPKLVGHDTGASVFAIHWVLVLQRLGLVERNEPSPGHPAIQLSQDGVTLMNNVLGSA